MRLEVLAIASLLVAVEWRASRKSVNLLFWLRPLLMGKHDDTDSSDDDNFSLFEKMRRGDGEGHPGDNTKQNKAFDRIMRDRGLNPEQARRVHDAISGRGYSIEEIEQIADDMKSGG